MAIGACIALTSIATLKAQQPPISDAVKPFVSVDAPVVALTNARVIDGTGAPPRERQTIILRDGWIATIGGSSRTAAPADARVIDLAGKSVIPGLVMLHEHLYYPVGPVRKVDTVFRRGVGYDPKALIASVTGRVGLW